MQLPVLFDLSGATAHDRGFVFDLLPFQQTFMIDRVLRHPEFREHPPVLVDIGASGKFIRDGSALPSIRSTSVLSALSQRCRSYITRRLTFHRFHVFAAAASDVDCGDAEVHLTSSPSCFSPPPSDEESLGIGPLPISLLSRTGSEYNVAA